MNYEEMLLAREGAAMQRVNVPFGTFYRKLIDKKYRNVVELSPQLTDSLAFCEALKADQRHGSEAKAPWQLHYELHSDSGGIYEVELEQGTFLTLSQRLDANPATVAEKGFIDNIITGIMDALEALHSEGILQLCLAPQGIFLRRGSNQPLLLCHGSFYKSVSDVAALYEGCERFVAPEVLAGEDCDERSDVYALGKLIEYFHESGGMPVEMRLVVRKATAQSPSDRYASVADMKADLGRKRGMKHTAITFAAAMAIVAFCIALYFDVMPQKENIEFVKPNEEQTQDDPYDGGFNPATELGLSPDDTLALSDDERRQMEEYQAKAEEIFRKRFEREADRVLSKVYNDERMSANEKSFKAASLAMSEELIRLQAQLAGEAGITEDRAGQIATPIITRLSQQKQAALDRSGYQRPRPDEEE